jgi:aerobic-type carbon monoxide dehydrogenase small subunit (CoxS/CutS family)
MPTYSLRVNGAAETVDVPAGVSLLWVLRDELRLTGTKYGCGEGLCGSCTVLVDGRPERSCRVSVEDAVGKEIRTIEGLSPDASHAVQRAWLEEAVSQCGYCQPGMILAAAALLERTPQPTDRDIDRALGRHVCRCGSYSRIRRAIHRAAGRTRP